MRKLALSLSLALVLALAISVSAFAAANLSISGHTAFRTGFGELEDGSYGFHGNWRSQANFNLSAGSGNITANAIYRARTRDWNNVGAFNGAAWVDFLEGYVTLRGPLFPGGNDVQTRIGRFVANFNPWVANVSRRDALWISGIALGPVGLDLWQGWETADRSVSVVSAKANVDVVELSGAYVAFSHPKAANEDERSNVDYAVSATVKPVDGVSVTAEYASNGGRYNVGHDQFDVAWGDPASAWKVSGQLATVPNFTVTASTWNTDSTFRPVYRTLATTVEHIKMDRTWTSGYTAPGTAWGDPWMANGFSIGVNTTQAGLPINVTYKTGEIFEENLNIRWYDGLVDIGGNGHVVLNPADLNDYYGKGMNVLQVGTTIAKVNLDVAYTAIEDLDPITDVVARYTLPVDVLGGNVALRGSVRLQDNTDNQLAADATWRAPNGLFLGLHYANYDRVLDWDHNRNIDGLNEGMNIGKPGEADGFAITAGYSLTY